MAGLQFVPVIDVQIDNIKELWPTLTLAVRSSTFIALDTELSGLGDRKQLNAKNIDDRYKALVNISTTRSVLSVGLSCFKLVEDKPIGDGNETIPEQELMFVVQTFNILMLCSEDYIVEPLSLRFLVNHGFDFNRQYAAGIPYYRGSDKDDVKDRQWLRELFSEITLHEVPVVFHNGYVDLGFLYQSFHTTLPTNIASFLADVTEVFPGGVYDTKYIAEYKARFPASYLEYVFRKSQRQNLEEQCKGRKFVTLSSLKYPSKCTYITHLPCHIPEHTTSEKELCMTYAAHGWCSKGVLCDKSHDINMILDADEQGIKKKKRARKRKRDEQRLETSTATEASGEHEPMGRNNSTITVTEEQFEPSVTPQISVTPETIEPVGYLETAAEPPTANTAAEPPTANTGRTQGHRAGFDSFMTGFIFAYFMRQYGKLSDSVSQPSSHCLGMADFVNKVALTGKDIPLHVVRSNFAKNSKAHKEKMDTLRSSLTLLTT